MSKPAQPTVDLNRLGQTGQPGSIRRHLGPGSEPGGQYRTTPGVQRRREPSLGVIVHQLRGPARRSQELVETGATYWHTVDFLWVLIFALLYVVR